MSRLAIIIPVKDLQEGKSRLAGDLTSGQRYLLNLRLLKQTLDQAGALADLADVRVVSRSPDVLAEALRRGFSTSLETGQAGLNEAVSLGTAHARLTGAHEIMVLPTDLPWLSADRLRVVVAEFRAAHDVMVLTDRRRDGTNLLLWRPIETTQFHYGIGSALRHADAARERGLRVIVWEDPVLSFDLDTPQDLAIWAPGNLPDAHVGGRLAG